MTARVRKTCCCVVPLLLVQLDVMIYRCCRHGVTLEWADVWMLVRLGGWVPHKDRQPGKLTLTRGLRRLMEMLMTEAMLTAYWKEHGAFPPKIAAFLRGWQPPEEL